MNEVRVHCPTFRWYGGAVAGVWSLLGCAWLLSGEGTLSIVYGGVVLLLGLVGGVTAGLSGLRCSGNDCRYVQPFRVRRWKRDDVVSVSAVPNGNLPFCVPLVELANGKRISLSAIQELRMGKHRVGQRIDDVRAALVQSASP